MKHVSTRAANADNNRIVTGRDIYEIAFTPPIHTTNSRQRRVGVDGDGYPYWQCRRG